MNLVAKLGYGIMCFSYNDFLDVDSNIAEVKILSFKTSFRETASFTSSLVYIKFLKKDLRVLNSSVPQTTLGSKRDPWVQDIGDQPRVSRSEASRETRHPTVDELLDDLKISGPNGPGPIKNFEKFISGHSCSQSQGQCDVQTQTISKNQHQELLK